MVGVDGGERQREARWIVNLTLKNSTRVPNQTQLRTRWMRELARVDYDIGRESKDKASIEAGMARVNSSKIKTSNEVVVEEERRMRRGEEVRREARFGRNEV